jgi:flavin reductase (DIM6/NTAB) family NADH-FMN oxidoreductase RutF
MGKLNYGVYVLTSTFDESKNGCTVSWVSQVSFDPPIVTLSLAPGRFSHQFIKNAKTFALSILPDTDRGRELGRHFGVVSGRKFDQFANIECFSAETGAPIIKSAVAYMECKVLFSTDAGDHTVFFGEVISGKVISDAEETLSYLPSDYLGG